MGASTATDSINSNPQAATLQALQPADEALSPVDRLVGRWWRHWWMGGSAS